MAAAALPERHRIYTSIFKDEELEVGYSPKFKALLRQAERDRAALCGGMRECLHWTG